MQIPAGCGRMVRAYEADGYVVVERPSLPGALAMQKDMPHDVDTIYIKTKKPFLGVSFKRRDEL